MPPKHKFGRKRSKTKSNPRKKQAQSSTLGNHIIHSTIPISVGINNETSLNSHSILSATDVLTITDNDQHYVRLSKQILQCELQRKRIKVGTKPEQEILDRQEITLLTSITSDWRVILQDWITTDDLRQGCISLFDQVNSDMSLSQTEMNHAVRFLEYAGLHIKYHSHTEQLLETIFPKEKHRQTKLVSSLINLLSLPSDTLQTVVLSFLAVGIYKSTREFSAAVTLAGLLPKLIDHLKPHEIPLNGTTIEFHSHLISILDDFFRFSTPEYICHHHGIHPFKSENTQFAFKIIEPIFQSFSTYLQHLITAPVCPTNPRSGISLLLDKEFYEQNVMIRRGLPSSPNISRFFDELRKGTTNELASWMDIAMTGEELNNHLFFEVRWTSKPSWVETFTCLLSRSSEGKTFSDLGVKAFLCFMSSLSSKVHWVIWSDAQFELKIDTQEVSSPKLDLKALWALFTPTQPHHAVTILAAFRKFLLNTDNQTWMKHVWNGWFPNFSYAVDLANLPFTREFTRLHTDLIKLMSNHLNWIRKYEDENKHKMTTEHRNDLDELYRAFYTQTKDYVVHISLHPFALDDEEHDTILDFLSKLYLHASKNSLNKPYREEVRQKMDTSALSSSSPPLILTSDLVCPLTDNDILNVVDRVVARLESNSSLDDDTILRIFAFHKKKLESVYLPELFRNAGRSNAQYFHALGTLLSLLVEFLDRAPIHSLLSIRPDRIPSLDEWDEVDLETVGIVLRMINENQLAKNYESKSFESLFVEFAIRSLPQARFITHRLSQPQLERLIAPSADVLGRHFIQPRHFNGSERVDRQRMFIDVCHCCDQRVIALCLSRTGFFSRFVTALLDFQFNWSPFFFQIIIDGADTHGVDIEDQRKLRGTVPYFLEEGWQDALDHILIMKYFDGSDIKSITGVMMRFLGTNVNWRFR
ncbi:hypothetical protein BLNAU_21606 [Blattamonas nauphoetae]|uniref:Uncharacterized protein n=1 Tax=Blattamonas nauphoetae TaxID=2049346 RepID=A0ABQ9WVF6_9EUKA|nr:hypothetical protein BLNAU_21606 [Blattamonas nauphoetae]